MDRYIIEDIIEMKRVIIKETTDSIQRKLLLVKQLKKEISDHTRELLNANR